MIFPWPHSATSQASSSETATPQVAFGSLQTMFMQDPVIQEVEHEEDAAQIPAEEANLIADAAYASWVQHNADAQGYEEPSHVEKAYLLRMSRNPQELHAVLAGGEELQSVRTSLEREGHHVRHHSGAFIFVAPDQYSIVKDAVRRAALRPYHVIVTDTTLPLVREALRNIPSRRDVSVRDMHPVAYLHPTSPDTGDVYVVERTFLNIPRRLRASSSVVNSTTEAHGGINPRR